MKRSDFKEFYATIRRFLYLFATIWKLLLSLIRSKTPPPISIIKTSKQIQDEYLGKYKTRLLNSFNDDVTDWNSNVDKIINDKEKLATLLEDKHNYLEKKWRSNILIENTPRGNVFMFYDIYKNAFSYYCDQAVIPYDIANAVAIKYVLTFHCRDFFTDSSILPSNLVEVTKKTERPISKLVDQNIPFAKFKSYNTSTKKSTITSEKDKKINCFLHLGGTRNWTPIIKPPKANPINGFKTDLVPSERKLSYLDYKNAKSNS